MPAIDCSAHRYRLQVTTSYLHSVTLHQPPVHLPCQPSSELDLEHQDANLKRELFHSLVENPFIHFVESSFTRSICNEFLHCYDSDCQCQKEYERVVKRFYYFHFPDPIASTFQYAVHHSIAHRKQIEIQLGFESASDHAYACIRYPLRTPM